MRFILCAVVLFVGAQGAARLQRDTAVLVNQAFGAFKDNCHPKAGGGCRCDVLYGAEVESRDFWEDKDCKKPVEQQTAEHKKELNKEIKEKFGAFKDNCFPKPSGGCKCNVNLGRTGEAETVVEYHTDAECRKSIEQQTADNKKDLNAEIKEKFGAFKENCFPKPSGGCKCNEKDASGNEVVATYNTDGQCKELIPPNREKRAARDTAADQRGQINVNARARTQQKQQEAPSQNVRDPVRERAQANYRKVVEELNEKFKGLKEGCYPRPKGCLCVTGKTAEGREITQRFMKDADCKCREGERGPGCPAA